MCIISFLCVCEISADFSHSHQGETRGNWLKFRRDTKKGSDQFTNFNLFLVILLKFGSLFYTRAIPYKPYKAPHCLGYPCFDSLLAEFVPILASVVCWSKLILNSVEGNGVLEKHFYSRQVLVNHRLPGADRGFCERGSSLWFSLFDFQNHLANSFLSFSCEQM